MTDDEFKEEFLKGLQDVKEGRYMPIEEFRKKFFKEHGFYEISPMTKVPREESEHE